MMWPLPDGDPFFRERGATPLPTLDERLTRQVAERLRADPVTRDASVTVTVQNGVALLSGRLGRLGSEEVRRAAAEAAQGTPGVRDVCLLTSAAPAAGSPESRAGRTVGIAAAAWLLGVLVVALGWIGVLIGCLIAAVVFEAVRAGRSRPADR